MRFYHGSSAEPFDRFDASHAGEGDGKSKFGAGLVYVSERYETAAHYAYNKHRAENKHFYVYTLEAPEVTEDNCLSLRKRVPVAESIVRRVEERLGVSFPPEAKAEGIPFRKYLANLLAGEISTVKKMTSSSTDKGEWAVSKLLPSVGVKYISWPVDWDKPDDKANLVILDGEGVRILRIEQVELTPDKRHQLIEGTQKIIKEF